MFFRGAVSVKLPKGKSFTPADFGDGTESILALYNNDMGVSASLSLRYHTGEKAKVNIAPGAWHTVMVAEIFAEGSSIPPGGVLAYR